MSKLQAVAEIGFAIYQGVEFLKDTFKETVSNDFYKTLDKLLYLTPEKLIFVDDGKIIDSLQKLTSNLLTLGNIAIGFVITIYGLKLLMGKYFSAKFKPNNPWNFFMRVLIVAILMNGSYGLSFQATKITNDFTLLFKDILVDEGTSFSTIGEGISNLKLEPNEDEKEEYSVEGLLQLSTYFLLVLVAIMLGVRNIVLKILLIFSPIIVICASSEYTERIFKFCATLLGYLLSIQIIAPLILNLAKCMPKSYDVFKTITLISTLMIFFILVKSSLKICNYFSKK